MIARHADLAVVASTHVYDTVIRQTDGLVDQSEYQRIPIRVKETDTTGWLYLHGRTSQPRRHLAGPGRRWRAFRFGRVRRP